jgi:hypothetical protein
MRTGLLVMKCTVVVAVLAMVTSAMAQGQGGGRRGGRGGGGFGVTPLAVIQNEKVQGDLVLSEDQKSQVAKLVEENMGQAGGRRGGGAGGAGGAGGGAAAFQAIRDEQMKKIDDVLLQPQQDRFAQIMLQLMGTSQALADAKVADKLGLTADQKSKLEELVATYRQKRMDLFMGGQPDPTEMTKLTTEQNDKSKDLLTADQKAQFDKMLGAKIDIDPATLRGNRGNRGRRGAGATPNA